MTKVTIILMPNIFITRKFNFYLTDKLIELDVYTHFLMLFDILRLLITCINAFRYDKSLITGREIV